MIDQKCWFYWRDYSMHWLKHNVKFKSYNQQHTTLHPTAGLPLKLTRVGPCRSLDGSPDAAGSDVGGPVGGHFSSV